ncbi:translation initiation factor IF-2-like [Corvus hawaiiensis]|uniref:translation initiation factor IF-2-like n=1 Tax=Corvus hawaiiensis TaxID=134902 RepID=UPI0020196CFD|nr:translation initiation factor IF-2-like [Corvus hawaiiensis]
MPVPEPLPWSVRGSPGAAAAAAALELLREEGAGPPAAPQKRKSRPVPAPVPPPVPLTAGLSAGDMHDFFVGLMGKRAAEPGRATGRGSGGPAPRCSPGPPAPGEAPLRAA